MYHQITSKEALALLNRDMPNNVMNIDTLRYLTENQSDADFYVSDDALIMAETDQGKHYVYVCPLSDRLDAEKASAFVASSFTAESICVDIQQLDENNVSTIREHFEALAPFKRVMKDFVCMRSQNVPFCEHIRTLTGEDKDIFVSAEHFVAVPARPSMQTLFQVFVERRAGAILAYIENGIIKGYLSYQNIFDSVYDVDYIYVAKPYRSQGIGKKLGQAYLSIINNKSGMAVWSNAKTEASEKLALSIGFIEGRRAFVFMRSSDRG